MSDRTMETEEAGAVWDGGVVSGQPFVHPGPAKLLPEADECAHTALSLIYRQERDAAAVEAERLFKVAADALDRENAALATLARVWALLGDTAGPLWSVRGVREADLRAALKDPS